MTKRQAQIKAVLDKQYNKVLREIDRSGLTIKALEKLSVFNVEFIYTLKLKGMDANELIDASRN
jgi:hypothetical protein